MAEDRIEKKDSILLFNGEKTKSAKLQHLLSEEGFDVTHCTSLSQILNSLRSDKSAVLLVLAGADEATVTHLINELKTLKLPTQLILHEEVNIPSHILDMIECLHIASASLDDRRLVKMVTQAANHFKMRLEHAELSELVSSNQKELREMHGKLREDKNRGSIILQNLLVEKAPKNFPGISITASTFASQEIDGDFIAFFRPTPYTLDLALGDVMGKGLPSALIATNIKEKISHFASPRPSKVHLFDQESFWHDDTPSIKEVLQDVHRAAVESLLSLEYFITLFYGRIDTNKRIFTFINCGFTKPVYFRQASKKAIPISTSNFPLGTVKFHEYTPYEIHYEEGDFFVLHSDAISEAQAPTGELYGEKRLIEVIENSHDIGSEELIQKIKEDVSRFTGESDLQDDFTLVIIKIEELVPAQSRHGVAKFNSALSQLSAVRKLTQEFCNKAPGNIRRLGGELQLAMDEIFTNIVLHGYKNKDGSPICIRCEYQKNQIMLEISDQGETFDPHDIPDVNLLGDREHGYGWYLIRHIVDRVVYAPKKTSNGWNHIRLYKNYHTDEGPMELESTTQNGALIIKVNFDTLDAKRVPEFKEQAMKIINEKKESHVIFDLQGLEFIDSSGLGAFLSLMRQLNSRGGHLSLASMNKSVKTIFELVSMQKIFDCYETVDEALKEVVK